MQLLPTAVRRRGYQLAFNLLRVYWFLRRPDHQGVKCVLTDGAQVLLVRHTYGPRVWEIPGGSINRGEPPVRAATREVQEELGVLVSEWTPLGEVEGRMDYRCDRLFCFGAEIGPRPLHLDPGEIATSHWFAWDELPPDLGRASAAVLRHACGAAVPAAGP